MAPVKIVCYKCKHKIEISEEDLIDVGRQQVLNEVNNLLLRLKK